MTLGFGVDALHVFEEDRFFFEGDVRAVLGVLSRRLAQAFAEDFRTEPFGHIALDLTDRLDLLFVHDDQC